MYVTTSDLIADPIFKVTTTIRPEHDYRRIHVKFAPGTDVLLDDVEAERLAVALAEGVVAVRAKWTEAEIAADAERMAQRDAELDPEQDEPDFGGDGP